MEANAKGSWINADGPDADVVMSCRARLARNIAGFPFMNRATSKQRQEILYLARQVLLSGELAEGMVWVDLTQAPEQDRRLLVERHLISKNLADCDIERAVAISADETMSVMVNEEDHLRMQRLASGLQLDAVYAGVNQVDDCVEAKLDYAFSKRWGYLTACPTNVGTGIRFSVMMHLPALKITGEIERVRRSAKALHLAVRGYYGEGSDAAGDFYQISNQVTLGPTEEDLLDELQDKVLPTFVEYERHARRVLLERNEMLLEDRTQRALAVLRAARLLGVEEAMKLLSRIRLALHMGRLPEIEADTVNHLFLEIQPAHLRVRAGHHLEPDDVRALRARVVREALGG